VSGLVISGCGVLSPAGLGLAPLADSLADAADDRSTPGAGTTPPANPGALADFDVRLHLGRKGTSFLDRATALTLVACSQALEDSGLRVDDDNRHRVGVTVGTTVGSLRSMSDYTRETLVEERPYLVNPALFPNTVMNCAAGQSAIRYGLRGINATIAGGRAAFLSVLRYAASAVSRGYADAMLVGAVEELSPHRAWATHLSEPPGVVAGEGAAVFVLEGADAARGAGRHVDAEVLAVTAGFGAGGRVEEALRGCVRRALARTDVDTGLVTLVTAGRPRDAVVVEAARALGVAAVERVPVASVLGECHAASCALEVAALLALHRDEPARDGRVSLVAGITPEGGAVTALLRGFSRVGADHQ
jgi:3-oxoacyl-[acyl-carrier-protein] synthase II